MFSKTCEYAIRAMIFIAQKSKDGQKVGIKEIANGIDSPEHFIAKILQDLSRKNVVQSVKGPNGGFFLEPGAKSCSLADIVRVVDGDSLFSGCGVGLKRCNEKKPCPIHFEFKKVRDDIRTMLEGANIVDFAHDLDLSKTFLKR